MLLLNKIWENCMTFRCAKEVKIQLCPEKDIQVIVFLSNFYCSPGRGLGYS